MKQIIIALLLIIVFLIGYGQYKQYKRFNSSETVYETKKNIDLNYHSPSFLLSYYEAVETLNNYIVLQRNANEIDVLKPEEDDEETKAAMAEYGKKLTHVKLYEARLIMSANLKEKGLTNDDIKLFEQKGITLKDQQKSLKNKLIKTLFYNNNSKLLSFGDKNALVFEIQKILLNKGYNVHVDGVFKNETVNALKDFEEKNQFYPDGKLDALTLDALLK